MILQINGFCINEYEIPKFTLTKGVMIGFWVEQIPCLEGETKRYLAAKKIQESIRTINQKSKTILRYFSIKYSYNLLKNIEIEILIKEEKHQD